MITHNHAAPGVRWGLTFRESLDNLHFMMSINEEIRFSFGAVSACRDSLLRLCHLSQL